MKILSLVIVFVLLLSFSLAARRNRRNGKDDDADKSSGKGNKRKGGKGKKGKAKKEIGDLQLGDDDIFIDKDTEDIFNDGYIKYKRSLKKDKEQNPDKDEDKKRRANFARNGERIRELRKDAYNRKFTYDDESIFLFMTEGEKQAMTGLLVTADIKEELPKKEKRPKPPRQSTVVNRYKKKKQLRNEAVVQLKNDKGKGKGRVKRSKTYSWGTSYENGTEWEKREEEGMPDSLDLRTLNMVTDVKMQGSCGSCWAFAAVAVVEGAFTRETGLSRTFSEQEVMNCNTLYGCESGFWTKAWKQIRDSQYIALESDQEYTAMKVAEDCDETTTNGLTNVLNVGSWSVMREDNDEGAMLNYLNTYGPMTVSLLANDTLYYYKSGIINECMGGYDGTTHVVTLVGYAVDYLLLKNSWGTEWGEGGYFRLQRGCGIDGYSYWASYLSITNIAGNQAPFVTDDEVLVVPLTADSNNKLKTTFELETGVLNDDIFHLEIPAGLSSFSNFNVKLKAADGTLVYFLYVYNTNSGRYCRERTHDSTGKIEASVRTKCPLSVGNQYNIDISVTEAGFSTMVGPTQLPLYNHRRPYETITIFFVAAGKINMISVAERMRTVTSISGEGDPVTETCYDKDGTCKELLEESSNLCTENESKEWMEAYCALTCAICTPGQA